MISCRYCPFYVAGKPPYYGVCFAVSPFAALDLRDEVRCPFSFDELSIKTSELSQIINGKEVKALSYFAASSDGHRSPFFSDVDRLREYIGEWNKQHCSIYGVLIDQDRHIVHTIKIGEASA